MSAPVIQPDSPLASRPTEPARERPRNGRWREILGLSGFALSVACLGGCRPCEQAVVAPESSADASPAETAPAAPAPLAQSTEPSIPPPPATRTEAVVDQYHGVSVADPYRWLEDANAPEVQSWSDAQNDYARAQLAKLPNLAAIGARVRELYSAKTIKHWNLHRVGTTSFAMKRQPPAQQPFLVVMEGLDPSTARPLVDPNTMSSEGRISIDWYVPSPNGKLVAISLSKGGSESGDLHFFDVATGKQVYEVVKGVNGGTAGGSLQWSTDGRAVFYTRYPREGERPEADRNFYVQVYRHRLGTSPEKDSYEIGRDFPRIAEIELKMDQTSGRMIATVQNGDGGEFALYIRSRGGRWQQFSRFGDRHLQAEFGRKNRLLVLSRADAPKGKILEISAARPNLAKAKLLIAEGEDALVSSFWRAPSVVANENRIYLTYQLGGPTQIRAYDYTGALVEAPQQLPVSSVGSMSLDDDGKLLFSNSSFVDPGGYFAFDPKTHATEATKLMVDSPIRLDDIEVQRAFATSRDGTRVPFNMLMKRGTQIDGRTPTVVTGYGGYGLSRTPHFMGKKALLLEQGLIYVIANIRGGSEYGESWHLQGNLTNKQNVFDDFAAVITHLQAAGYTSPDRTVIVGGSNGGLLMGATMVQNPGLVAAVVSKVGIYDMMRVELSPNGAFNIPEFGTVQNLDHFKAMIAYSPYHNVVDGVNYPPVLFTTGANDPRVDPMQSRKMTARLQAATNGQSQVLLRTSSNTGHGGSAPLQSRIEEATHVYGFMFDKLGVDFRPPSPTKIAQQNAQRPSSPSNN